MASGTQQQQQQQQQQQRQQEHLMQHQQQQQQQQQQQNHQQMQFAPNLTAGIVGQANFDLHQQQMHQTSAMSPSAALSVNHSHAHIISMNPHQQPTQLHQQQQNQQQLMGSAGTGVITQTSGNQPTSHIQQQKSQILPLLLSPRPPSLTPNSADQTEQSKNDHEQIIDQVISLENEFSDSSGMLVNVDAGSGIMIDHQQRQQQHHLGDINLSGGICIPDSNQFSSSEDLINLLLEFDREPSNLIGLGNNQQMEQDEKVGIETIRKQLMSCEMQSEQQQQNANSMSPIINQQLTCQAQQSRTTQQQQHQQSRDNVHQHKVPQQQQLISQTAPVISRHQQPHQMSSSGSSQQQQMSADQSMLHSSYSNVSMSNVPVSSSGQSYAPQQQQQHVTRISQSNPMPIATSSPSPSWQQPQLSPYSPQPSHNNSRTPSQRQGQQHHAIHSQQQQHSMAQQHQATTSPQMQQLHHPLQQNSPSQSVSPPATSEPSPVVKKNPLLNAQLVNSRAPSLAPTRFMNSQANVLNQNPILNAKLSQSSYVTNNNANIVGSPVNPSLNQQSRFMQQNQSPTNFNFDINHHQQQQQQQNAQQHTPQQPGHMTMYASSDQQPTNQTFRTTPTSTSMSTGGASINIGSTSPSGDLSQQVKQEIRRKVQQPKQQHQTTSLLKQLLSDDNK